MWRSCRRRLFLGKECFYWLFLAFGYVDSDMMEVTEAVCDERAPYAGEATRAAGRQRQRDDEQDDDELDLAERIPCDKRSQAFILQENARKEEKKFKAWWLEWRDDPRPQTEPVKHRWKT